VVEDLIFDRRREGYDPLQKVLEIFSGRKAADNVKKVRAETVEGRLKDRIVDGDRKGLEDELADSLGATVKIAANRKGAGSLTIRFGSLDQLDGLLARMK